MPSDKPLREIYKKSFFGRRDKLLWRVPIVCNAIADAIRFDSVIDVGCAIGDLVQGFSDLDKQAFGIEGSSEAREYLVCGWASIYFHDLRKPLPSLFCRGKLESLPLYGLVTCLEVAEHIEPEYAERFAKSLCELSDRVLLSAAPPGQGGHHHVNCQPIEYWDGIFLKLGFVRKDEVADKVKAGWQPYRHKAGIKAYEQNLHYYEANKNATPDRRNDDRDFKTGSAENNPGFLF